MLHYIIDGNNLIGKDKNLSSLQAKDKQLSREQLAFKLDNYFGGKKVKVTLCFDGFKNTPINTNKVKVQYSDKKPADDIIRTIIESSKNRNNIVVITSDRSLSDFARVCRCKVIPSEEFAKEMKKQRVSNEEEKNIKSISNDEIKRLFDV